MARQPTQLTTQQLEKRRCEAARLLRSGKYPQAEMARSR